MRVANFKSDRLTIKASSSGNEFPENWRLCFELEEQMEVLRKFLVANTFENSYIWLLSVDIQKRK